VHFLSVVSPQFEERYESGLVRKISSFEVSSGGKVPASTLLIKSS
jgi:hypothetical protein